MWLTPDSTGLPVPSTKLLVGTVGWTATVIIALRSGRYVAHKAASIKLYREVVGDEWMPLVSDVYDLCRGRWQYLIPPDSADQRTLRTLCEQALGFQNHFLRMYRTYLLTELFGQIVLPDQEVSAALRRMLAADEPTAREAARATLTTYTAFGLS